jgi:hypothetical protein
MLKFIKNWGGIARIADFSTESISVAAIYLETE